MPADAPLRRPILRVIASGSAAALLYGGWGYVANCGFGPAIAVRVAAVQALWSFALTIILTTIIEIAARRCVAARSPIALAALPALLLVWVGPSTVHHLNETPKILHTIAPGAVIGTAYVVTYVAAIAQRTSSGSTSP